jgi:hypothetical protein
MSDVDSKRVSIHLFDDEADNVRSIYFPLAAKEQAVNGPE